jgi:hypothetical protein
MAVRSGVTSETFMAGMRGISVPDEAESARLIGGSEPALLGPAQRLADVMLREDLLRTPVDPGSLVIGAPGG